MSIASTANWVGPVAPRQLLAPTPYAFCRREHGTRKNLSENLTFSNGLSGQGESMSLEARRLLKADQRIGQAEKGQIAPGELVPANDEPPIAIKPGVQPFHHPAPWTLARLPQGLMGQLLGSCRMAVIAVPPIGAYLLGIAARLHLIQGALVAIAGVRPQMPWGCLIGRGTADD